MNVTKVPACVLQNFNIRKILLFFKRGMTECVSRTIIPSRNCDHKLLCKTGIENFELESGSDDLCLPDFKNLIVCMTHLVF